MSPGPEDKGCGAQLGSEKCSKLQYCPPINSNQEVAIALTLVSEKSVISGELDKRFFDSLLAEIEKQRQN